MASNAADLLLAVQKAQDAVSDFVDIKHRELLDISSSPRRTIDELTKKWRWFNKQRVEYSDAWFRAIHSETLQEIEAILMLSALEKDMKDLEIEIARWTRGETPTETAPLLREAVSEDVRLLATRVGGYLLLLHCSRNGPGELAHLKADASKEWNSPDESDTAVITHLKSLRGNCGQSLQASIMQALQFFGMNPDLEDEFSGSLQGFLGQLKLFEHLCDVLILPLSAWPMDPVPDTVSCKSSVCQYISMGPAHFGPGSSQLSAAWTEYQNADGSVEVRGEYSLWKLTWQQAFSAIEKQHHLGHGKSDATSIALRTFFGYNVLFTDDSYIRSTPKHRSRAQVIAMARARKNPDLPTPSKPKAGPLKETSTPVSADNVLTQITITMPKPKPGVASSSRAITSNHGRTQSHLNWGWTDSLHANKPSQFEDDAISTPRAEPKQKTRGTPNATLAEEPVVDSDAEDSDAAASETLIFTDPILYGWMREIFPLSSTLRTQDSLPEPTGRVRFTDLQRLLRSEPLSFKEIHIGMPECRWETPCGKWFTFHTPHKKHGGWIQGTLLKNLRGQLKRAFGWTGEEFMLDENLPRFDDGQAG